MGLAWNPNGEEFYVSGGSKDLVYVFSLQSGKFANVAQISLAHPVVSIGTGLGLGMLSTPAGMAVNAQGDTLVVVVRVATLAIAALALMLGSFIYFAHFSGAPPGSTYVPAHIENGKFVPGTTK